MKIEYILYIINLLDNLNKLWEICFWIIIILSGIIIIFYFLTYDDHSYDDHSNEPYAPIKKILSYVKPTLKYYAIFTLFILFVPNEKTMYMMAGASLLKESAIPSKISQTIELKLDEIIKKENPLKLKDKS